MIEGGRDSGDIAPKSIGSMHQKASERSGAFFMSKLRGEKIMNHIYQLADTPIDEAEYLTDAEVMLAAFPQPPLYVEENHNRGAAIEELMADLCACGKFVECVYEPGMHEMRFVLREGFREAYFKDAYDDFLAGLRALAEGATLKRFIAGELGVRLTELKDVYESDNTVLIWYEDELMPIERFMREIAEPGIIYYLGGIVDYKR